MQLSSADSQWEGLHGSTPRRFRVAETEQGLKIRWRWFDESTVGLIGFSILWDGLLCGWYSTALRNHNSEMALFPILHVLAGVGMTYAALAGCCNRTRIELNSSDFHIRHGPLPWMGNRSLAARDITQFFCKYTPSHGKSGVTMAFTLFAVQRDGELVSLLELKQFHEVSFLEQRLERHLGITPQPVFGECRA